MDERARSRETEPARLREAARRLAAAMDRAGLYQAAAYAQMASDAVGEPPGTGGDSHK